MDINLELYRVFYYVANTLSFSEASRQLFISQSAVSQSVKSLEKSWDILFLSEAPKKSPSHRRASFSSLMSGRPFRCWTKEKHFCQEEIL